MTLFGEAPISAAQQRIEPETMEPPISRRVHQRFAWQYQLKFG